MLKADPVRYRYFGAAQVVKHYLGIKSAQFARACLLYLFWEPLDHAAHDLFAAHRGEVEDFGLRVSDAAIDFRAMSYPELFAQWDDDTSPPWLREHVACLRRRYGLRLDEPG